MDEDWEANNKKTYAKMKKNHKLQWDYIDKYISENDIKSILDVGCGEIQHIGFSGDWVGIDVNSTIKNDKVILGDFFKYKFDREFDLVLIAGLIEHYGIEELEKFIQSALRVNPKYIILTSFMGIREGNSKLTSLYTSKKKYLVSRFGKESIKELLTKYNLENYFIEKINSRNSIIIIRSGINERA